MNDMHKNLVKIQQNLNCIKGRWNKFGEYYYRSCEDIVNAVKSIIDKFGIDACLLLSDELVLIGDRYYIRSTATLTDGNLSISTSAFAREALAQKGMNDAQITGSSSSYARKYALNGLFGIDDTEEIDSMDNKANEKKPAKTQEHIAVEKANFKDQKTSALPPPDFVAKINEIKTLMSRLTEGMSKEIKLAQMKNLLGVDTFSLIDLWPLEKLDSSIERLKKNLPVPKKEVPKMKMEVDAGAVEKVNFGDIPR